MTFATRAAAFGPPALEDDLLEADPKPDIDVPAPDTDVPAPDIDAPALEDEDMGRERQKEVIGVGTLTSSAVDGVWTSSFKIDASQVLVNVLARCIICI